MDLMNNLRVENGLKELQYNPKMQSWANIRAQEFEYMWTSTNGGLTAETAHTRPDGTSCTTGGHSISAENPAWITTRNNNAKVIVDNWYNSAGHNRNMLKRTAQIGTVSCYIKDGKIYAAHLFSEKPMNVFNNTID